MKMKSTILAMLALSIFVAVTVTPSHAVTLPPAIYARTDKSGYAPGDSGILYITVRNVGTQAITIQNVSVTYPWKAFITNHWDGNFTTTGITQPIAQDQTYNTQYTFTVPTDGRVGSIFGGTISISIGTDIGSSSSSTGTSYLGQATILFSVPTYQPLGLSSSLLPIIEIVLLGIAVVMLALVFMKIDRVAKK
jgi:hypothetical protein